MSKNVFKFGSWDMIKFIEIYRNHECLWDTENINYKNREARDAALKLFSIEFGTEDFGSKEIINKIKNIRTQVLMFINQNFGSKRNYIKFDDNYWERRKAALRTKRHGQHKARRRRQIEPVSSATDADATDSALAQPSRISAGESGTLEWSGATGGPPAEVVLRLHPPQTTLRSNISSMSNSSETTNGSGVVVRAEEALIVAFVLLLWVAAIALFFNRWGKIRMLEPYQPKFQQQHRQSCALAEASVSVAPHHRASLSRGCVSYDCGVGFPAYQPCGYLPHRLRQNSVFVGSMGGMALIPESPPRRSRSVADLPVLVPPSDPPHATPRSSRAASLHSAVDLRICVPSPRASRAASLHSSVDMPGSVQVHIRGSGGNLNKPRSPRRLTITNV